MKYKMINDQDGNIEQSFEAFSELDALYKALSMAGWNLTVLSSCQEKELKELADTRVGNKIIVKYMVCPDFDYYDASHQDEILDECDYNSSWDRLHPVIAKISSLSDDTSQQVWQQIMDYRDMMTEICKNNILVPFNCVIEFIEWHNDNKG